MSNAEITAYLTITLHQLKCVPKVTLNKNKSLVFEINKYVLPDTSQLISEHYVNVNTSMF